MPEAATSWEGTSTPLCAFIQYTGQCSGSPISGLTVVDALRSRGMAVTAVFGVRGPLEDEYRARGCGIHYLPHGQWLLGGKFLRWAGRWRWEIQAIKAFLRLFHKLRPCLVYVNTLMSVSAVIAARTLCIPVVWHVREQFTDENGEMHIPLGGRGVVRWLVRGLPTQTVFVSRAVQLNVIGAAPCTKSRVLHNPLKRRFFDRTCSVAEARRQLGIKDDDSLIVGVPGTLRPVKGHEFLLQAAAQLLAKDRDYRFIISGGVDNVYGKHLRQGANALGIADHVQFVGAVTDMRLFYTAADIICVPSRGEPFGRTVIEAFAQERAVIATRVGGILETVTDGETGRLIDYGDVPALVCAIQQLRSDTDLRAMIVANALSAATQRFHEDVYRRELNEVLAGVGVR